MRFSQIHAWPLSEVVPIVVMCYGYHLAVSGVGGAKNVIESFK